MTVTWNIRGIINTFEEQTKKQKKERQMRYYIGEKEEN